MTIILVDSGSLPFCPSKIVTTLDIDICYQNIILPSATSTDVIGGIDIHHLGKHHLYDSGVEVSENGSSCCGNDSTNGSEVWEACDSSSATD